MVLLLVFILFLIDNAPIFLCGQYITVISIYVFYVLCGGQSIDDLCE